MYTHKYFLPNNFIGTIYGYIAVLNSKKHDFEDCPHEIMDAALSELFFTNGIKNA